MSSTNNTRRRNGRSKKSHTNESVDESDSDSDNDQQQQQQSRTRNRKQSRKKVRKQQENDDDDDSVEQDDDDDDDVQNEDNSIPPLPNVNQIPLPPPIWITLFMEAIVITVFGGLAHHFFTPSWSYFAMGHHEQLVFMHISPLITWSALVIFQLANIMFPIRNYWVILSSRLIIIAVCLIQIDLLVTYITIVLLYHGYTRYYSKLPFDYKRGVNFKHD